MGNERVEFALHLVAMVLAVGGGICIGTSQYGAAVVLLALAGAAWWLAWKQWDWPRPPS